MFKKTIILNYTKNVKNVHLVILEQLNNFEGHLKIKIPILGSFYQFRTILLRIGYFQYLYNIEYSLGTLLGEYL